MPIADDTFDAHRPWHKQFWPWFLVAVPMAAVIGGLVTLYIAMTNIDGLVVDDYYKQGLAINRTLARDTKAQELGLAALARIDLDTNRVHLQLAGDRETLDPEALRLLLVHPTRSNMDITLDLKWMGHGSYISELPALAAGKWHLLLEPKSLEWRLTGRVDLPGESAVRLGRQKEGLL